jgi:superfamily II DNA or RNA helicase
LRNVEEMVSGLRPWQAEGLSLWRSNDDHGIAQVVTGGGKTRLALACIASWLSGPQDRCLIIVPTLALQDQWVVALEDDLLVSPEQITIWGESSDTDRQFQVMVINTARSQSRLVASTARRLFLIADECHRYASPENSKALAIARTATLGLTATAQREYDDGLETILIPLLGEIIIDYSIVEATRDGVVSPFELHNVQVPLLESEETQIAGLTKAIGRAASEGDDEKVKSLAIKRAGVSKRAASRLPVTVRIAEEHSGSRILIFHEDIESAELITRVLQQRGTPALAYHSKISPDVRRDNLRLFKSGVVPVLVSCRALDEGVDIPEVTVAIVAAATSSQRQRVQRLGRALRKAEGKSSAQIYTLYATTAEGSQLRVESERLADIAKVSWSKVTPGG